MDTPTTDLYTLTLHDALPIYRRLGKPCRHGGPGSKIPRQPNLAGIIHLKKSDRKSTRLKSSHVKISYAVFCLKKKKVRERHAPEQFGRQPRPDGGRGMGTATD